MSMPLSLTFSSSVRRISFRTAAEQHLEALTEILVDDFERGETSLRNLVDFADRRCRG